MRLLMVVLGLVFTVPSFADTRCWDATLAHPDTVIVGYGTGHLSVDCRNAIETQQIPVLYKFVLNGRPATNVSFSPVASTDDALEILTSTDDMCTNSEGVAAIKIGVDCSVASGLYWLNLRSATVYSDALTIQIIK